MNKVKIETIIDEDENGVFWSLSVNNELVNEKMYVENEIEAKLELSAEIVSYL